MASIIKSNTYADFNGREILTANNDGALTTQKILYPAFEAYMDTAQNVTNNTWTKITFESEEFDTDNAYDNTTNYRFTPQVAGKYFVYINLLGDSDGNDNITQVRTSLYKNGSVHKTNFRSFNTYKPNIDSTHLTCVINLNGSTDYIEAYGYISASSGTPNIYVGTDASGLKHMPTFGAYRIGS